MQEALLKVKMDLGNEAVIMNSRKVRRKGIIGLFTKPMVEVVAAIDDDYAKPRTPLWTTPASNINGSRYYENSYSSERSAGTLPQTPAYGREAAPFQPQNNQQAIPKPQPMVSSQSQYPYSTQQPGQQYQQVYQTPQPPQSQIRSYQPAANTSQGGTGNPGISEAENSRLDALETKVKSMETMLEKLYLSVKDINRPNRDGSEYGKTRAVAAEPIQDNLSVIRKTLVEADLDNKVIDRILEMVRKTDGFADSPEMALLQTANVMTGLLGEPDIIKLRSDGRPQVVIFVGPTGVGKTTTLAKIAADFTLNKQKKVGLITADTYRIAAVEQLKTYSEILGIPVLVVYSPSEVKEAIKMFTEKDLILIDTAGRSHRNKNHFDELKALFNTAEADEAYLVVSANTGRHAMNEILEYYSFIKDYKLLFTKLDETPAPGVIVNARYLTGRPLSYITAGQSVPDDLNVADPRAIVASLLGTGTVQ